MATFGVIITNRSFFPDHLVLTARRQLLGALEAWGHRVITLSAEDTFMRNNGKPLHLGAKQLAVLRVCLRRIALPELVAGALRAFATMQQVTFLNAAGIKRANFLACIRCPPHFTLDGRAPGTLPGILFTNGAVRTAGAQ